MKRGTTSYAPSPIYPAPFCPFFQSLLCGEVMKLDLNSYEGRRESLLLRSQSQCSCVFDRLGRRVIIGNSHPFGALQTSVLFNSATATPQQLFYLSVITAQCIFPGYTKLLTTTTLSQISRFC